MVKGSSPGILVHQKEDLKSFIINGQKGKVGGGHEKEQQREGLQNRRRTVGAPSGSGLKCGLKK